MARLFRRNDKAVTEVIGYVLSFALSAIFLLIALNVFSAARGNTEHVVTGVELKTIADRVAGHVVELGLVSQEFPNATMEIRLVIPQSLNGKLYTVTATAAKVSAATNDAQITVDSTTYKTESLPDIAVGGDVDSSNEQLRLRYSYETHSHCPVPATPCRHIEILGE